MEAEWWLNDQTDYQSLISFFCSFYRVPNWRTNNRYYKKKLNKIQKEYVHDGLSNWFTMIDVCRQVEERTFSNRSGSWWFAALMDTLSDGHWSMEICRFKLFDTINGHKPTLYDAPKDQHHWVTNWITSWIKRWVTRWDMEVDRVIRRRTTLGDLRRLN